MTILLENLNLRLLLREKKIVFFNNDSCDMIPSLKQHSIKHPLPPHALVLHQYFRNMTKLEIVLEK